MPLCLNQHCLTQLFCCLDVLRGRAGDCRVFCLLPECTAESVQLGDSDLISAFFYCLSHRIVCLHSVIIVILVCTYLLETGCAKVIVGKPQLEKMCLRWWQWRRRSNTTVKAHEFVVLQLILHDPSFSNCVLSVFEWVKLNGKFRTL